jgi:IS5 family transposase
MVGAVRANRAILSEAGLWPPAGRGGADAAHLFPAAVVQSVGPGGGGGAVRFVGDAAFCRHRPPPSRGQALGREPVPDETTVCRFRHLLDAHDLGQPLFDEVQRHLAAKGVKVATGTIVDATIINAHQVQSAGPGRTCDRDHQGVFGFAKVRYRGLKKNTHRLLVTCALANLFTARRQLLGCQRS